MIHRQAADLAAEAPGEAQQPARVAALFAVR
jgi:hypothetical protein